MKSIVIDPSWDGRRLTRFLQKTLPAAPMGQIAKFLRLGRVKVDGKKVATVYDVMDRVNEHNPGETVTLEFYRGGQYYTVEILLGSE